MQTSTRCRATVCTVNPAQRLQHNHTTPPCTSGGTPHCLSTCDPTPSPEEPTVGRAHGPPASALDFTGETTTAGSCPSSSQWRLAFVAWTWRVTAQLQVVVTMHRGLLSLLDYMDPSTGKPPPVGRHSCTATGALKSALSHRRMLASCESPFPFAFATKSFEGGTTATSM